MYKIFLCLIAILILPSCEFYYSKEKTYPYEVTIYRDIWGVPHIYGKTDMDAAFGLAYANAEDDYHTIQDVLLALRGM